MDRLWATVTATLLMVSWAGAASPDPRSLVISRQDLSLARSLVQRLGDERFREREQAQKELAEMGRRARLALREAVNSDPSAEIRSRAAQLLPRAESAELQLRIETFLADTEGKFEHDLPGWNLFRKCVGDKADRSGATTRNLYVELLKSRSNLELLVAIKGTPEAAGPLIADRRYSLFLQMNPQLRGQANMAFNTDRSQLLSLVDVAGLLFAESVVPAKYIPRTGPFAGINGATFAQQPVSMNVINNPASSPHGEAYRRILIRWIESRTGADELGNVVYLVTRLPQMKEANSILRRIIDTTGVAGWAKAQAVIALAQRNGKDEIGFLKTLLTNDLSVGNIFLGQGGNGMAKFATCQLRDVALAMLIAQSGQKIQDYGYEVPSHGNPDPLRSNYPSYAFPTDEARVAALKKWANHESASRSKSEAPRK